jgi:hypothetical protein
LKTCISFFSVLDVIIGLRICEAEATVAKYLPRTKKSSQQNEIFKLLQQYLYHRPTFFRNEQFDSSFLQNRNHMA